MADYEKYLKLRERSPGDNWRVIVELAGKQKPLGQKEVLELECRLQTNPGIVALRGIVCVGGDCYADFQVSHADNDMNAMDQTMATVDDVLFDTQLPAVVSHAGLAPESQIRPDMPPYEAWSYTEDWTHEALELLDAHREHAIAQTMVQAAATMDSELSQILFDAAYRKE